MELLDYLISFVYVVCLCKPFLCVQQSGIMFFQIGVQLWLVVLLLLPLSNGWQSFFVNMSNYAALQLPAVPMAA